VYALQPAVGGGARSQRIVLRRLDVTARVRDQGGPASVAAPADRARSLWRDMLEEHAAHSSPDATGQPQDGADAAGLGDVVPQWSLKCSREQQLQQLCLRFTLQCTEVLKQVNIGKHAESEHAELPMAMRASFDRLQLQLLT
jgi:hypothetical protein